jgi:esterase/lipase superfamily enzyme
MPLFATKLVIKRLSVTCRREISYMVRCGQLFVLSAVLSGLLVAEADAARILNLAVEARLDQRNHVLLIDLLFDPGETAVELQTLALEFKDGATPPLSPIPSNNPATRGANGQYAAKTVVRQDAKQRMQKVEITVPLNELKLPKGMHEIAYQVQVLQDGKPVEHVCAPKVMVSVAKEARVTGTRTTDAIIDIIKPQKRTIEVPRTVDGQEVKMPQEITVRLPESRQIRRSVPVFDDGNYSEVFAFAPPPEVQIEDPNIKAQIEEMQAVPWTPPRTMRINFATTRNIVNPSARDATKFGGEMGDLTYGSALVDISVSKTHGERPAAEEPVRPTPQDSFKVSQIAAMSEDAFFQAISNTLWHEVGTGATTKDDIILFVHGYNNSFRFSCVRFAQLVYDTRFEGRPILFSWPANGGDSLMDELTGIISYGADLKDAKASVESLVKVLREIAVDKRKPSNASKRRGNVHLVAHSMGSQLLVDALEKLQKDWRPGVRPFKSVILAAPDVDSDDLTKLLDCVRTPAERVTLYYCEADRALWASSQYHASELGGVIRARVGQALCILPQIENIDANKANTTFMGHSYFVDGSLVLRDLEDILQRDYAPELRVLCPDNKLPEEYAYWKMIDDKTQCQTAATTAAMAEPPVRKNPAARAQSFDEPAGKAPSRAVPQ